MPDELEDVWAIICPTNDADWPCTLNVLSCSEGYGLGRYPDLAIAHRLFRDLSMDVLCGVPDFVPGLDPQDPYWSFACIGGRWFLASTCGTALMGPYI